MAPRLTLHQGDSQRAFHRPLAGRELIDDECELMAERLRARLDELNSPGERAIVEMLIDRMLVMVGAA